MSLKEIIFHNRNVCKISRIKEIIWVALSFKYLENTSEV